MYKQTFRKHIENSQKLEKIALLKTLNKYLNIILYK